VIKLKDIAFGLDNIIKAAEIAYKNEWSDQLYKCSYAIWYIIEPWFLLHYDFSKLFISYIFTISKYLENIEIKDYEWYIHLHFKLSKTLYIASSVTKDIKLINTISLANNTRTRRNTVRNLKSVINTVRNSLKVNQSQAASPQTSSSPTNNTSTANTKNIEKSLLFGIVKLNPELHDTVLSLLKKTSQISSNFIEDSLKNIDKAIQISLKYVQDQYLDLYKFYIYILKKEKPDQLNYLRKFNNSDKMSKIKAIYTSIQNLNFSSNVSNDKLNEIDKQITSLFTNNKKTYSHLHDDSMYDSDASGSALNCSNNNNGDSSQTIYNGWNEVLLLVEYCQLCLKVKNFKLAGKTIKNITKLKQLTFNQYAKFQLLLAEYIFNVNINKIEDIFCEKALRIRLDFLNKLDKMINYYTKINNSPNIIQECVMKIWEYGVPLLQPQYKHYYYPFLKRCYEVLIQINSPLYSLTSVICKELVKYSDEVSNISDAKMYIKNAYKYCFDRSKIEDTFEYKNVELKIKSASMENTTFNKTEEAMAMINQIDIKNKNMDELKNSLYKILKILIPKHENHMITNLYPLMDSHFEIDFELDDPDNISQLKFFIEVLKQLLMLCYKIKYWDLIYEITSYIICHDYSSFPEHEKYFKLIIAESLIKRVEALANIRNNISSKKRNLKKTIKHNKENEANKNKERELNTNTLIYILLNNDLIKTEIEDEQHENENKEQETKNEKSNSKKGNENEKQNSKKEKKEKKEKKGEQETEDNNRIEIHEIHKVYGNELPKVNNYYNLEKIYFNDNDVFASSVGSLTLDNLQFILDIFNIMEIGISTNSYW